MICVQIPEPRSSAWSLLPALLENVLTWLCANIKLHLNVDINHKKLEETAGQECVMMLGRTGAAAPAYFYS